MVSLEILLQSVCSKYKSLLDHYGLWYQMVLKTYVWKVIHGFDGYDCQMTEKILFTHGKKTTIHTVYLQKM